MTLPASVLPWISSRRAATSMRVEIRPWSRNSEWTFADGVLRHVTGGFFSIAGATQHWPGTSMDGVDRPMILQPEPGLLGFVVAPAPDGFHWLLQAKSEPGTTNYVQIGPSVQATQANYRRLHGGAPTQFLGLFANPRNPPVMDTLQSEQGTQFITKSNRNAVLLAAERFAPNHPDWSWVHAGDLRHALAQDYLINTDARSVIVTAPWRLISSGRGPFAPHSTPASAAIANFTAAARESHANSRADITAILARLNAAAGPGAATLTRKPLAQLTGWRITDTGISSDDDDADTEVRNYGIWASDREVPHWHQPLLCPRDETACALVFRIIGGRLKLFLRHAAEPGYMGRIELGPSWQTGASNPPWLTERMPDLLRAPLLAISQSDEGGRFMHSVARYSLHLLDTPAPRANTSGANTSGEWVDLGQLEALCARPLTLTNEARSAVSLLLSLA